MGKSNGQIAYEAYCQHTNWKSLVSGADLPQWDAVKPQIREAWERAAEAVAAEVQSMADHARRVNSAGAAHIDP